VLDRTDRQPSGSARSATGHCFGTLRLRELLAARGEAGLWLAEDDDDGSQTLLRLYPGLPKLEEWHTLELAASQVAYAADARLVRIRQIALDIWPRLTFDCPDADSLSQRIAREPLTPEVAVAMCADVTGALAALERAGVPPVDISPADILLVGERARLLADVGLPGGKLAHACIDLDHVAPERAVAISERAQGIRGTHPGEGSASAATMTYALASIAAAALHRPPHDLASTSLPARLEQVLRRGLAHSPAERYPTPAAFVDALGDAVGVDPWRGSAGVARARAPRARPARPAAPREWTMPGRRWVGIAIPAAVVGVAAAIGIAAGSASTPARPPAPVTLAGAGLSVEAPQGWLRGGAGEDASLIGSPLLAAHAPGGSRAMALVVTRTAAPLLARLEHAVPEPVRLGAHDAWRYRDVAVDAQRVADVYVLEESDGPLLGACLGPSGSPVALRARCAAALTTLRLSGGQTAALGGDASARRALAGIVAELDRERASERHALAAASTGRRQAAAADRLAAAYAHAADRARGSRTIGAPGQQLRLVGELEQTGRAYAALATAARSAHRTSYTQARDRVLAHERAFQQDLAALAATSASP